MAFQGGLSFNLKDVNIPAEKVKLVANAQEEVEERMGNYNMGFITNNERYNQIIDIWTRINNRLLTNTLMKHCEEDNKGSTLFT